ncbi:hypothetical protein [Halovivax gelatinilyticus]|uniref:hypothetical protein n=1 Tax=Halovivax gelatinilyticus TaxID=2961597 RepID=UPI0020CA44F1|nr:hypothetical protein [Halovivax gelatinilyticus]
MTRYKPHTHKPFAQPAYHHYAPTRESVRGLDPYGPPHYHWTPAAMSDRPSKKVRVTPAPPRRTTRPSHDPRDAYPPCPKCGEPIVLVRTFGPERHNADPCGCGLTAYEVKHLVRSP